MSRWLALATEAEESSDTPFDSVTKHDKTPSNQPERGFCQVLSNCQVDPGEKAGRCRHDIRCGPKLPPCDYSRYLSRIDLICNTGRYALGNSILIDERAQ